MKSPQRRPTSSSPAASVRRELGRVLDALRELAHGRGQGLQPALVPIPVGTRSRPARESPLATSTFHLAFGRRKDSKSGEEEDGDGDETQTGEDADGDLDQLPPIPSALEAADQSADSAPVAEPDESSNSWRPLDPLVEGPAADEPDEVETGPEPTVVPELPTWSSRSLPEPFPEPEGVSNESPGFGAEPAPWGATSGSDEPATFSPAVVDPEDDQPENLAWLRSGAADEAAPWAAPAEPVAASAPPSGGFSDPISELVEIEEIEPETPQDEQLGGSPEGLDSVSEVLVVADEPWSSPASLVEETLVFQTAPEFAPSPAVTSSLLLQTRSFPLPLGEVVFRNLRAGFTDPSRLLRHLAAEGHTGVLHVQGVDGGNSYVVLVDVYVVAVANARQGTITTTNRITFPNFPNSQDTINVISYSRQIARGLGLLLHAPVRFAGLGAMFVNLEGLRSYLSKYGSSGGLIGPAQDGIGVALFEAGKLVGAYSDSNEPTTDLGQLRELVKDLEAEIDVRFGGPKELAPIPLDTLLSGYPL